MTSSEPYEDEELTDLQIEEEYRGHKIVCTCKEDPDWCELHAGFF